MKRYDNSHLEQESVDEFLLPIDAEHGCHLHCSRQRQQSDYGPAVQ